MKKPIAIALLAVALTGCSLLDKQRHERIIDQPTRAVVIVTPDRYIVVDREPLLVRVSQLPTTLSWKLAGQPGAKFAERGITIDARVKPGIKEMQAQRQAAPMRDARSVAGVKCQVSADRSEASCSLPADLPRGTYAYTIRLDVNGQPVELDPTVMVDG